jgi:hypothetical protein
MQVWRQRWLVRSTNLLVASLGALQHDAAEVGAEVSGAVGACWEDVAGVEEAIEEVWEKKQRLQEEEERLQSRCAAQHAALQVLQGYKALQEYSRLSKQAVYHSRRMEISWIQIVKCTGQTSMDKLF